MPSSKQPAEVKPADQAPQPKGYLKSELRARINKRLHSEGRFEEMRAFRDSLMAKGYDPHWAFRTAAMHFPPLDGNPLEFDSRKTAAHYLVWKDEHAAKTAAGEPVPPTQKTPGPELGAAKLIAELAGAMGASPEDKMKPWHDLRRQIDDDRKCSPFEAALWVFKMGDTPVSELTPEQIPGRNALRLLRHVSTSDRAYDEFLRTWVVKFIPDKRQMEQEARFADDGRRQQDMLDAFDREFEEQEDEDT